MKMTELDRALGMLDQAFDATPQAFSDQVDKTLRMLKDEKPKPSFPLRTAVILALTFVLLCGVAYALFTMQGQDWYFENRFPAYKEIEPEKYHAMIRHVETDIPQVLSQDPQNLLTVSIQDYSWSREQNILSLSFAARAVEPEQYELFSFYQMDVDGAYVTEPSDQNTGIYVEDEDNRSVHWFSTDKGFGPAQEVMLDPDKQLLVVDFSGYRVWIGNSDVQMPMTGYDVFTGADGASVCFMQFDLNKLNENWIAEHIKDPAVRKTLNARAKQVNAAMDEATDSEDFLSLRMNYQVYPYANDTFGQPANGSIVFKLKRK